MKKIALAVENFSKYGGGGESYAVSLATTLIKHGWEVHVFGEKWDNEPKEVRFHKIYIPKFIPSWIKQLLFVWQHKGMIARQHFDIIIGFGNTICMNVYQSHGGVHWYSTARKVYSEKNILRRIIKRILIVLSAKQWTRAWIEGAAFRINPRPKIIAISDMIKRDMETFFHINPDEIEIVYNGVDTNRFNKAIQQRFRGKLRKQWGLSNEDTAFLFASYELKKKGIEPLVEAARKLKIRGNVNFKIIVAGGQPYHSLEKLIKRFDLQETIIFAGRVNSMEEYYANSDVFVLPTYYDSSSLVLIEAMASGIPSITTTFCGACNLIQNGKSGYVISHPPNSSDLADKMLLLMDKGRRKQMSQKAYLIGQKYSAERNHKEIIRILDKIMKLRSN